MSTLKTLVDLADKSYVGSLTRLTQNVIDAISGSNQEPLKVLAGTDHTDLDPDTIKQFKKDLTETDHSTAKKNMFEIDGMNNEMYKEYVSNAARNHEYDYVTSEQEAENRKNLKAVRSRKRKGKIPPIAPSSPKVTPPPEDVVKPPPRAKRLKKDNIPPTYDIKNAPIKFDNQRLSKTAPISNLDLYHNMAWQGMQQLGLMAATSYLGGTIGPEAAQLMYQGIHALNKIHTTHGATPVELAAAQGLEAVNEMVETGGIVKAHNKFNALKRGQLESVTSVDQQVISAFAKGLRTMNSVQQAEQAQQQAYKTSFGGI